MKKWHTIILVFIPLFISSQHFRIDDQQKFEMINKSIRHHFKSKQDVSSPTLSVKHKTSNKHSPLAVLSGIEKKAEYFKQRISKCCNFGDDTLVIGDEPGEELLIEGIWEYDGTIIILNDGIVRLKNAQAMILGDIYIFGMGQFIADSSQINIPQLYFYQRQLFIFGQGIMNISHSLLNFGGMVHSIGIAEEGKVLFVDVEKPDFSTIGLYGNSEIIIDSIDMAGEFIIGHSCSVSISNAETILLWHRFPEASSADLLFPDGEYVHEYTFNNEVPGVTGIGYQIQINNCSDVMWALMPSPSSDITVTDSDLRAIGLWFEETDTMEISGLVNYSNYVDYTAPLEDRTLRLINTELTTWSLYGFDKSVTQISGCILGETGAMGSSSFMSTNVFIDGSGGYVFSDDSSLTILGFSSLTSSFRNRGNSYGLIAYSTLMNGDITASDQAIIFIIQSELQAEPMLENGAAVWMMKIDHPVSGIINSLVDISGSAWIDLSPSSLHSGFSHHSLYYQASGEENWTSVYENNTSEIRDGILCSWNTHGMEAGAYILKLQLYNNDDFFLEAYKDIHLLPEIFGIDDDMNDFGIRIYPNPVLSGQVSLQFNTSYPDEFSFGLYEMSGKAVITTDAIMFLPGEHIFDFSLDACTSGVYILKVVSSAQSGFRKIIVY